MQDSKFDKVWTIVFVTMFLLILLPFPWFYQYTYVPGWLGVPCYIWAWLCHGLITLVLILIYANQALKRPEYHEFDDKGGHDHE